VPFGAFGFFGRIGLRTGLGGGGGGWSCATAGFGSSVTVADVMRSPGVRTTCTGMLRAGTCSGVGDREAAGFGGLHRDRAGVLQPGRSTSGHRRPPGPNRAEAARSAEST